MEDNKRYTMAELWQMELERFDREEKEAKQRKIDEKNRLKEEKERKHQEYLLEKERRHQEYLLEKERRENTFEDKNLVCKKCGKEFLFSASEQKFFKEKGFFKPSMCKECRANIKVIKNFHKN